MKHLTGTITALVMVLWFASGVTIGLLLPNGDASYGKNVRTEYSRANVKCARSHQFPRLMLEPVGKNGESGMLAMCVGEGR